jgi:hypothetical protein
VTSVGRRSDVRCRSLPSTPAHSVAQPLTRRVYASLNEKGNPPEKMRPRLGEVGKSTCLPTLTKPTLYLVIHSAQSLCRVLGAAAGARFLNS